MYPVRLFTVVRTYEFFMFFSSLGIWLVRISKRSTSNPRNPLLFADPFGSLGLALSVSRSSFWDNRNFAQALRGMPAYILFKAEYPWSRFKGIFEPLVYTRSLMTLECSSMGTIVRFLYKISVPLISRSFWKAFANRGALLFGEFIF